MLCRSVLIAIAASAVVFAATDAVAGSPPPLEILGVRTGMTPAQFKAAVASRKGAKIVEYTVRIDMVPAKNVQSKPFASIITSDLASADIDRDRVNALFTAPPNEARAWTINRELSYRNPVGPGFDQTIAALTQKFGKPQSIGNGGTQTTVTWAWQHNGTPATSFRCGGLADMQDRRNAINESANDAIDSPGAFAQAAKDNCARVINVMLWPDANHVTVRSMRMVAVDFEAGGQAVQRTTKMVNDTISAERAKDAKAAAGRQPQL